MSCGCYSRNVSYPKKPEITVNKELLKVLRVIGEEVVQIVEEATVTIPVGSIKIDKIHAVLQGETVDHVFKNKIVKQGTFNVNIFYVGADNIVHHTNTLVPFMAVADIPGVCPDNIYLHIQNHVLDIDTDYTWNESTGELIIKLVAHILIKVTEWTQLEVVTGIDVYPRYNTSGRVYYD